MSAADAESQPHLIALYQAEVIQSDYAPAGVGIVVYLARCRFGWSVVRQLRRAVEEQVAKHRKEVAA